MKIYLIVILTLFLTLQVALAEKASTNSTAAVDTEKQAHALFQTVSNICQVPSPLPKYSENVFKRFVYQTFIPELKMLNTAFLVGFQAYKSNLTKVGYCIITFLGHENDSIWEKRADFYQKAIDEGTLPSVAFAGFDPNTGEVMLKPMLDQN